MLRIFPFQVDVTPPCEDYICGGLQERGEGVESPLFLRGIVLDSEKERYVLAAIDYCYMIGQSHDRFITMLAEAARTTGDKVTIHSNHVHDAPLLYEEVHTLIHEYCRDLIIHNEDYVADVLNRSAEAVAQAIAEGGIKIGRIAFTSHAVDQFASTRRVLDGEGRCHIRWSVTEDQWIRSQPEGRIDPMLDQITFFDQRSEPRVCLNFYACHPQVSNGRKQISSDTIGVALNLFERRHPGVFPVYFDGCGGDITAGKYTTDDRPRNRLVFGVRLYDAMEEAFLKVRPSEPGPVEWVDHRFDVPLRGFELSRRDYEAILRHPGNLPKDKYLAALKLVRMLRNQMTYNCRFTRMSLGRLHMLFMPAEMCVEYQLYAKSRCDGYLAVAAYGDSFLNYVATDAAFDEGGYEVRPEWTEVDRGIEQILKRGIDDVLKVTRHGTGG